MLLKMVEEPAPKKPKTAPKLKLTYFNIQGPAEPARLALTIGGIDFEDVRVTREEMLKMRESGKLLGGGQLPQLQVDDKTLSQSEAMTRYCGHLSGLYPTDPWLAAKVDEVTQFVNQDIRDRMISVTMREADPEKKAKMRKELGETQLPEKFALLEKLIQPSGFFVGDSVSVADLHVYVLLNWIGMEVLDGVSKKVILDSVPLTTFVKKINALPKVAEWNAAKNAGKLPWC